MEENRLTEAWQTTVGGIEGFFGEPALVKTDDLSVLRDIDIS